jgi:SNF2 family DNA or RNA helicase
MALSGTPVGGKPINLWKILHWLHPDKFTSQWRWAEQWLTIEEVRHSRTATHKEIGDIREGLEEDFYKAHSQYFLRRTKDEVLPWLPPKNHIDLWAEMGGAQEHQYKQFALQAEVKIGDHELSATSILAEYTRLKQFAIALNDIEVIDQDKIRPVPTETSCKLDVLEELLDELGVLEGSDAQVVIFSQFTQVVNMVTKWLQDKGVSARSMTGETKSAERTEMQNSFQDHQFKVMVMNVHTGGVSITLDAADTVVFMDETWVPDDQEQAEDRCHRASRNHQVNIYTIRTKHTIEEYIHMRTKSKQNVNRIILDLRRAGLRAA